MYRHRPWPARAFFVPRLLRGRAARAEINYISISVFTRVCSGACSSLRPACPRMNGAGPGRLPPRFAFVKNTAAWLEEESGERGD